MLLYHLLHLSALTATYPPAYMQVCLMAHSMGSNVWQHFMQWVSSPAQGPGHHLKWVDAHVSQVVLIGNSLLGSPKVLPFVLLISKTFSFKKKRRLRYLCDVQNLETLFPVFSAANQKF